MHAVIAHVGAFPAEELLFWCLIVVGPVLGGGLYVRGMAVLPGAYHRGRRFVAFAGGMVLLMAIFAPPVDEMVDSLFSIHMAQHMVLIVAVPVLFTYSRAFRFMMMGVPRDTRRLLYPLRRRSRAWLRWSTLPFATAVFAVALWIWHVPDLYDLAVENTMVHLVEHATLLGAGFLLWVGVMDPRRGFLPRSISVFGTAFHSGLLGALLVLAPEVLYRSHLNQTLVSISPLQDQQLAGLIMWIPMGGVFLATLAVMIIRILDGADPGVVADV
ncbi:MAG: cytochrome c oxidase assembly protein [Acidimicrobiia bacterium]